MGMFLQGLLGLLLLALRGRRVAGALLEPVGNCSRGWTNCLDTGCCAEAGQKCYKQHANWAMCNATCDPQTAWRQGKWENTGKKEWDCTEHLSRAKRCSPSGHNCMDTGCCSEPSMHCFRKNDVWASCNETCTQRTTWEAGAWRPAATKRWDCEKLSEKPMCKGAKKSGENCMSTKCCADPGMKCFKQNEAWASCNKTCHTNAVFKNKVWQLGSEKLWECDVLEYGKPTCKGAKKSGENCIHSHCCADPKMKCFKQNEAWASCNTTCHQRAEFVHGAWQLGAKKLWDCDVLAYGKPNCKGGKKSGDNCLDTKCCAEPGMKCFKKNEAWASCNKTCHQRADFQNGAWVLGAQKRWECDVLHPGDFTPTCKGAKKAGENCIATGCCAEQGMTCFKKNDAWASCNTSCSTHMNFEGSGGVWRPSIEKVWECDVLTDGRLAKPTCKGARHAGENCMDSGCCAEAYNTCFKKTKGWASCNKTCSTHMTYEHGKWLSSPTKQWECDVVTTETAIKAPTCAGPKRQGENCLQTGCCADPTTKCFRKDSMWASCNETCSQLATWIGGRWSEGRLKTWECDVVRPGGGAAGHLVATTRAVPATTARETHTTTGRPLVVQLPTQTVTSTVPLTTTSTVTRARPTCTGAKEVGENCMTTGCCADPDMNCFKKDDRWAGCNRTCSSFMAWRDGAWSESSKKVWACSVLSSKTQHEPEQEAPAVCAQAGEDCTDKGCCPEPGVTCLQKDLVTWACDIATTSTATTTASPSTSVVWVPPPPPVAPPPMVECARGRENCMESKCCADPGKTCYRKQGMWAMCNATCSQNSVWLNGIWGTSEDKLWECSVLSPGAPAQRGPPVCTERKQYGQNCLDTGCCMDPSMKCFQRDEAWATCNRTCSRHALWEDGMWIQTGTLNWMCDLVTSAEELSAEVPTTSLVKLQPPPPPPFPRPMRVATTSSPATQDSTQQGGLFGRVAGFFGGAFQRKEALVPLDGMNGRSSSSGAAVASGWMTVLAAALLTSSVALVGSMWRRTSTRLGAGRLRGGRRRILLRVDADIEASDLGPE